MDAWIFIAAFTVVTMAPFMSAYDNAEAEWSELAQDEAPAEAAADSASETENERA
jgi:hypothetical protein